MFEHSVKVPRHFKIAANIVRKVSEEGGSVKTLLYDNKLKHFRTSVLYALINETIKHATAIEKIFEKSGILVTEPRLDLWLAKILTAELLYGKKKLPGKSKPEQTILTYREQFEKLATEVQDDEKSKVVPRPRYVRINTNLLTTSDAIRAFQDEGYKFIRCTSGSYNDYLQQIQNLTEYDFTQDYHVKTIFVFPPGTKMHEHDLYWEHKIVLQDKATALAVHLLAPPPGSVVLDMCAAPGMKTTQLAAYLRNQGKIYAVERNEKRYETLCEYVEATGSKCVETFNKDSLEIKRGDLDDVEYILLDPSCSGSGMELSVHNYFDETRLAKLTSLQEKFLKHAMNSFPNAKRIVYSTCSVYPEENERVVTNIVKASRAKWRVKNIKELLKEQWNNFGSGMYGSIGTRCLYAKPDTDFTVGFFVAVLDRDFRENEKSESDRKKDSEVHMMSDKKHKDLDEEDIAVKMDCNDVKKQSNKTKVKQDKCKNDVNSNVTDSVIMLQNDNDNGISKKSKKRKQKLTVKEEQDEFHKEVSSNIPDNAELDSINNMKIKVKQEGLNNSEPLFTEQKSQVATDINNKKKKRKKSEQCQTLEDNLLLEHFSNETEKEKTKKKKHDASKKEIDEHVISESIINQTEVVEFDDENKKQRKKRKKCSYEAKEGDIFEKPNTIENQLENPKSEESMLKERNKIQKLIVDIIDLSEKEDIKIKKKHKVNDLEGISLEKQQKPGKSKRKNNRGESNSSHIETQLSCSATINCDKSMGKQIKSINQDIETPEVDESFEGRSKRKTKQS